MEDDSLRDFALERMERGGTRLRKGADTMNADPPERNGERADETRDGPSPGAAALSISNAIVQLLRAHAGRGPTKAKTTITPEVVLVTLGDCLTTAETTLADNGGLALMTQTRHTIHQAIRADATAAVEAITGRRVAAYLADQHHEPDVAVIVFVFERPDRPAAGEAT